MGKIIRAEILKIDEPRRNIVISRRTLIENERDEAKQKLLNTISEGDIIKGTVTNVAEFGAFIDLGGIDGLLHVTDMSWGRIKHPSDICKTGEDIEVAFSWSRSVGPGNSLTIEKWLVVTPEPSSIALLGVGMALLAARFRRPSR